jgi:hypothetical protein
MKQKESTSSTLEVSEVCLSDGLLLEIPLTDNDVSRYLSVVLFLHI